MRDWSMGLLPGQFVSEYLYVVITLASQCYVVTETETHTIHLLMKMYLHCPICCGICISECVFLRSLVDFIRHIFLL